MATPWQHASIAAAREAGVLHDFWIAVLRGTLILIVALAQQGVASAQPRSTPASEGRESMWTSRLFTTGATLFVAGYIPALLEARDDKSELAVPLVGPWLTLFSLPDCTAREPFCEHSTVSRVFLIADGALQLAGVGMMVGSVTRRDREHDRGLRVRPTASRGGPGVVLSGRF
jgi:hypothetical protein